MAACVLVAALPLLAIGGIGVLLERAGLWMQRITGV